MSRNKFKLLGYSIEQGIISKRKISLYSSSLLNMFKNSSSEIKKFLENNNYKNAWKSKDFSKLIVKFRKQYPDKFSKIYNDIKLNPHFLSVANDSKVLSKAKSILGIKKKNLWVGEFTGRIDVPGDRRNILGWHIDASYYKNLSKTGSEALVSWIALCDVKIKNGAIKICPKSHENESFKTKKTLYKPDSVSNSKKSITYKIENKFIRQYKQKYIELLAGDVIFFDLRLIHRSGFNSSNEVRLSILNRIFDKTAPGWIGKN